MLFILESFNKKYLQSAYLMAKAYGEESELMYEFFNSVPNELKLSLKNKKLFFNITKNEVEWKYEVNLKTSALSFYATDNINKVFYSFTFEKLNKNNIYNIDDNELNIGRFEVKTDNNYQSNFLKQTRSPIYIKPLLYTFSLKKLNDEFIVKRNNMFNNEVNETRFNSNLHPIVNEFENNQ